MYTNELKEEIYKKLFIKNGTKLNQWIYTENYIKNNNLCILINNILRITTFIQSNRLDERIYCILNDIHSIPCCECGGVVKFKRYGLGYGKYCSVKCRANSKKWQNDVANTNMTKYGVTHIAKLEHERKNRSLALNNNRKNFDYSNIGDNYRKTIKERYGDNYNPGWTTSAIKTRIDNQTMVPVELIDDYRDYYRLVQLVTAKQPLHLLDNFEKRGVIGKDDDAHHVDHIVSIYDGFMNDVPAEIIGNICNLQCIPGYVNITKRNDSWMSIDNLLEKYNESRI